MPENTPSTIEEQPAALSVGRLYLQLASSRAATIESFLWQARDAPEPLAETLTLAAAGLAHVSGAARRERRRDRARRGRRAAPDRRGAPPRRARGRVSPSARWPNSRPRRSIAPS